MSVVATVAAVASSTPIPSPTVIVQAVAPHASTFQDNLNALASKVSVADLMAAAGAIVVGFQYLVGQFPFIKKLEDQTTKTFNWVISFLLPFLAAVLASVVSGNNSLNLAPYIYVSAQLLFFIVEYIKSKASAPAPAATGAAQQF